MKYLARLETKSSKICLEHPPVSFMASLSPFSQDKTPCYLLLTGAFNDFFLSVQFYQVEKYLVVVAYFRFIIFLLILIGFLLSAVGE